MEHRSFTDLEIWKRGRELRKDVFMLSKTFPKEEKYDLVSQIVRSSRSVCANIAEGHGRFHFQENIQFCRVARGSISETLDHMTCALDCEYIDESTLIGYKERIEELTRMINGYINYLKRMKKGE
ncbi:four helix bundle protein [Marinoscillum pacificum]|uniref:four helix bundle protein n=1 Tax=Marinoscillum pacificum TaxID=392723 RepID=UPI0021580059|nr:four helix bundle protein [Marinoscillum pacificum]